MSGEHVPNTEAMLGHHVADFVENHLAAGLWWTFKEVRTSRQPTLPFQRVEFQSDAQPWLPAGMRVEPFETEDSEVILYKMDVYFSVPEAEVQIDRGRRQPGLISVIVLKGNYDVEVMDRYGRLADIEEGTYDDDSEYRRVRAVESLMGELDELQDRELFVALRQRRFPLFD
ncbi:MAG TPA: hypothetical protein VHC21_02100 [Candidatus Saccharimonadales bacterium]|nr:hypothetical protein [Candidatus Saccharimonadales bacterium]